MTIETIYNEIKGITRDNDINYIKFVELRDKLEKEIRKNAAYKTTNKTRVNAIKKIASKMEDRLALTGYGICGDYKCVTDSYHAIMIKQDEMPLPLVATDSDLEKLGIDKNEYKEKYGETAIINATYPNLMNCITLDYDKSNELTLDVNDLIAFIKTNKKEIARNDAFYQIGEQAYNPIFVKNVIDVIGEDCKIYFQGINMPLYFVNKNEEIGIVLPVRKF
jgi:hypothetical protein